MLEDSIANARLTLSMWEQMTTHHQDIREQPTPTLNTPNGRPGNLETPSATKMTACDSLEAGLPAPSGTVTVGRFVTSQMLSDVSDGIPVPGGQDEADTQLSSDDDSEVHFERSFKFSSLISQWNKKINHHVEESEA